MNVDKVKNALPKSGQEIIQILSPDRSPERPSNLFRKRRTATDYDEECNKCKVEAALSLSSFGSSDEL